MLNLILGKKSGPPSQLQRVCVGSPTSLANQVQDRLNISWDPLPCRLQNGADISYIIQYTRLESVTPMNISSSPADRRLQCHQVADGPYSCLADASLFVTSPGETYRFQVAARSVRGVGPFSNLVTFMFQNGSQSKHGELLRQLIVIITVTVQELGINCMNHPLSDTNCTISSSNNNTIILTSSESDMPI